LRYKSGVLLRSAFGIALNQISDRSHFDCEAVPNFDNLQFFLVSDKFAVTTSAEI
jgi:hypothetical protein